MNARTTHNSNHRPVKQHRHHLQNKDVQQQGNQASSLSSYVTLPSFSTSSWWRNRRINTSREGMNIHWNRNLSGTNETMDTPSSEIYDACLEMNWDLALRLCRTLPSSAVRYQEGDNLETPLYVACQNQPPLPLVQTLLELWPDATSTKSRHGDIPIHIACRYDAHISVLQALLQCDPRTATHRTRFGTTPLMALWEPYGRMLQMNVHHSHDIVTSLATRNPTLYQKFLIVEKCHTILMDPSVRIEDKCQLNIFHHDSPFNDKWTITLELLKAVAVYRENYDESTIRSSIFPGHLLVHAAVALKSSGCPLWALFYVTVHYPEQYTMVDATGRFPLHIAIGPENSFGTLTTNSLYPSSQRQHWKFLPKEYWSIRLSLHFHSKSALLFDPNEPAGRYPLHTAIYYGHQWDYGVKLLVDAAPSILQQIDPTSGLYPFQLAATVCMSNDAADELDLIYELLRYDPTVLELCRRRWNDADNNSQKSRCTGSVSVTHRNGQQPQHGIALGSSIVFILAIGIAIVANFLRPDTSS
jgi:hypothetical protein